LESNRVYKILKKKYCIYFIYFVKSGLRWRIGSCLWIFEYPVIIEHSEKPFILVLIRIVRVTFVFFLEAFFWRKKGVKHRMKEYKVFSRGEKARKTVVCSPERGYFFPKKSILMIAKIAGKCYYSYEILKSTFKCLIH